MLSLIDSDRDEVFSRLRSCLSCRTRKIKCDRQRPCANCERLDVHCVYPPGPGRAPKQPRATRDARLLDRVSRLETIIRRLEEENDQLAKSPLANPSHASNSTSGTNPPVDNVLWARLGDEIEELRDALYEPTSEAEDGSLTEDLTIESVCANSQPVPRGLGTNAAVMGFRSLASSLTALHPSLSESVALLEIFKQNVAPLVRIFHLPTLLQLYWYAVASVDTVDKNMEALLFAIYYSAVISMSLDQCLTILGVARSHGLRTYRFAVEQALARANLLNTQNLILLQSVVLFLTALRNEDDSRTVWSLTALIFHIAQEMGLHRDGATFNLQPLETELRRRLWWYICLLDNRSSEYHGCQPIVQDESTFDTRMPLNINDNDLTADMREPPPERDGATEMTFCLIRCQAMRVMWKIGYIPTSMPDAPCQNPNHSASNGITSLADREALAQELQVRLETQYLRHYVSEDPFHHVAVAVTRLIIARTWLVVYYPQGQTDATATAGIVYPHHNDRLFDLSLQVLELSSALLTNKDIQQWSWHYQTHFQWHATVFVLSEICRRSPSPECDRAWEYVNAVYDRWSMKESEKRGALWRPIMQLMAKARYVREIQHTSSGSGWRRESGNGLEQPDKGLNGGENCSTVAEARLDFGASGMPSVFSFGGLDSLMDIFPDGSMGQLRQQGIGYSLNAADLI
ncbi:transcription factor domain-containing protein [Aspergillus affinis]|uniref:transcription factor domain-containing protein n=1 Tax=Aspergillus affinis TaxID=1070780 RepID=UPI0022FE143E|nr:fungal-specific transcription factor domain-containing protein [Aspergillus affinis]KAI9041902.1 fungal-specific transcription factor domain-containing protein [Aspergillus affinis]